LLEINQIYNEDCLGKKDLGTGMWRIPDKSIDLILCDLPYGQTARNKWDTVLPFDQLWSHYNRVIKDNGAIVLFANGMFTADLMQSNRKYWRYNLVWDKVLPSGFLNAKKMPMRSHEDLCVFYKKPPTYNPQMVEGKESHSVGKAKAISQEEHSRNTNYGEFTKVQTEGNMKYPKSILTYQKPHPSTTIHPTQKPVELCEWIINTYTNKGETVLDNCIGSGSTIVACINTQRNYVGYELDQEYYKLATERIHNHELILNN
jgi:site-specific DNA-methyltransferase (adenine-specific)